MRTMTWRFIDTGFASPAENMAIDEAIAAAHGEGKVPPTLRFYRWDPPALSLGYFQKAKEEVDFEALERHKLGFVRRATGGRAVLHDQELTYSMIVSEKYPGMPKSVVEAYRVLSQGLLFGFRRLELQAEMVSLATEEEKAKYATMGSAACFDSPSWYELIVEGRKVAGSAQTRMKGVVLQHGSILIELNIDQLFDVLRYPSDRVRERMKKSFASKAVAINDLRKARGMEPVRLDEVQRAFYDGIEEGMSIRLEPGELTEDELAYAEKMVEEKYGNEAYNLRR